MAFDAYSETKSGNGAAQESKVDWDAMNKYVVETANLQQRETLVGYIAGIVDLGTQALDDAEAVFAGSPEEEAEIIAEKPNTYFKDGIDPVSKKPVRLKCWPQDPAQCVTLAIDFPDIMLDKGQFFGEENAEPKPLRLWLGGQFYNQSLGKMVVARPTPLKVNKKLGDWSFDQKHLFYKMAVADKMIKPGEVFVPKDIDKLLGKAFQFTAQVFFKPGKDGKSYYTEYINFIGALGRGQATPEVKTTPLIIQMNKQSSEQAVKEVRAHVLNTCRLASNWEGSALQKQVDSIRSPQEDKSESKSVSSSSGASRQVDDFDDDFDSIPF